MLFVFFAVMWQTLERMERCFLCCRSNDSIDILFTSSRHWPVRLSGRIYIIKYTVNDIYSRQTDESIPLISTLNLMRNKKENWFNNISNSLLTDEAAKSSTTWRCYWPKYSRGIANESKRSIWTMNCSRNPQNHNSSRLIKNFNR